MQFPFGGRLRCMESLPVLLLLNVLFKTDHSGSEQFGLARWKARNDPPHCIFGNEAFEKLREFERQFIEVFTRSVNVRIEQISRRQRKENLAARTSKPTLE